VLAVVCLFVVVSGCSQNFTTTMSKREVVVVFHANTARSTQVKVRADCRKITPHASAEPMPTSDSAVNRRYGVRYRVDGASDQDLSRLYQCLTKHDSVAGVQNSDNSM